MTSTYSHDALWTKAKLFMSYAMDDEPTRTFDEQALWAALALELLGKAALARVSPLLIAAPTEDGNNLLVASGLISGDVRFSSVSARTINVRCSRAFKPFSDREATIIANSRNEFLHSGAAAMSSLPPDAWWPRFWAQAVVLVNAADKTIDDLVGHSRQGAVERYLAQNAKNIEHRTEMLLERARQRLALHDSGDLPARAEAEWDAVGDLTGGFDHRTTATCPACGESGVLEGENVTDSQLHTEQVAENDYDMWVDLTVGSDYFSCPRCHLVLDGFDFVAQAGLEQEFITDGDPGEYFGDDYGND